MIKSNKKDFRISTRLTKFLLFLFIIFTIPPLIFLIFSIIFYFTLYTIVAFLFPIFICFLMLFGIEITHTKVDFLINHEEIKVLIQNNLDFRFSWEEIKEIKVIEELYERRTRYTPLRVLSGYKLVIDSMKESVSIRLWCTPFSPKRELKIINAIENFSSKKNINLSRIKPSERIIRLTDRYKICSEIGSIKSY